MKAWLASSVSLVTSTLLLCNVYAQSNDNKDLGVWTDAGSSGVICIHTALLPNSKLLCVERPHMDPYPINPNTNGIISTEIDLLAKVNSDGTWTSHFTPIPIINNPFCAGHAMLNNGSILMVGGDNQSMIETGTGKTYIVNGRQGRRIFDPCTSGSNCTTGSWTVLPDMTSERWYPTVVNLGDDSAIIFGGSRQNLVFENLNAGLYDNPTYEYWPSKTSGKWPRSLEILEWAYPHNLYPMSFLLPSGKVFLFVSNKSIAIDPKTDAVTALVDMPSMDHAPWIYPHTPTMTILPMTIKNKFSFVTQVCGGSYYDPTTKEAISSKMCWQFNPDDPKPTWTRVDDMLVGRVMVDSIILPDGKIIYLNGAGRGVAGGDQGQVQYASLPILQVDLFDPEAPSGSRWTALAPMKNYRLYHSGVVLLESGHIVTMGSEMNNYDDYWIKNRTECRPTKDKAACTDPFNYNLERFEPPYLQKAARNGRPVIAKAPATVTHNSTFEIEMQTDPSKTVRVTFIRYSTVTHQTNTDQRFIELRILARKDKKVIVQAPDTPFRAPGGNWMLFCLDADGVPSVAKTILLQNGPATYVPGVDVPKESGAAKIMMGGFIYALFASLFAILHI